MKVFELIAELGNFPANADVQCVCNDESCSGDAVSVEFDGVLADDAYVFVNFKKEVL